MEQLFNFLIDNAFYSVIGITVAAITAGAARRKLNAGTNVRGRMEQKRLDRLDPDQWRRLTDYARAGLEPRI